MPVSGVAPVSVDSGVTLHQAAVEGFLNFDQAATNFELFITTVDISYVYATTANLEAAGNAFDRATVELAIWQEQAL